MSLELLIIVCVAAIVATAAAGRRYRNSNTGSRGPAVLVAKDGRRSAALGQTINRTPTYRDGP